MLGIFEILIGAAAFYLLGKRCQNFNKEYIELDEAQYNSVKDFINAPNTTPPRYNELEELPTNTITDETITATRNITNSIIDETPISPPPNFNDSIHVNSSINSSTLIRNNNTTNTNTTINTNTNTNINTVEVYDERQRLLR